MHIADQGSLVKFLLFTIIWILVRLIRGKAPEIRIFVTDIILGHRSWFQLEFMHRFPIPGCVLDWGDRLNFISRCAHRS